MWFLISMPFMPTLDSVEEFLKEDNNNEPIETSKNMEEYRIMVAKVEMGAKTDKAEQRGFVKWIAKNYGFGFNLFLLEKENFPIQAVLEIEHEVAAIIAEQADMGFYLDIEKARALNTILLQEKGELARELAEIFSPKFLKDGQEKSYKKLSRVKKYLPDTHYMPLIGTRLWNNVPHVVHLGKNI